MLIGELAQRCGVSARMLRHYDRLGLVSPSRRTAGDYREYTEEDVHRLFQVEGLRSLGLSLPEIGEVLADLSFNPASVVDQLLSRTRDRIARDQELLGRLEQVRASAPTAWADVVRTIELLRGLGAADPSTRQRLVLSRGDAGQDAEALAEALLDEADANVSGALQWALAHSGDRAVPVLARGLESPLDQRRRRAVMALAKLGSPAALAALAEALGHPDPFVRGRAALARGRLGEIDAVPVLVALIVEGRDDVEAAEVLAALAQSADQAAPIARALAAELPRCDAAGRQRLAMALAELPGPLAASLLADLGRDPDRAVALTASFLQRGRERS
ncbi:MAG: MerR family transcriptional regulator [Propionicimonas sp.]